MATTAKKSGRKPTAAKKAGKPIVEEPSYLCPYCNTMKKRSEYYVSTDPLVKTGVTSMCKECAKKLQGIMMQKLVDMEIALNNQLLRPLKDWINHILRVYLIQVM